MEKIERRNIIPIAAMVEAGKSKLWNVLFNFNFLECNSGITTKFVNILRYNPNIKEPRFYHLKVVKEGDEFIFYKDQKFEDIVGEKNIIESNKNINSQLLRKDISNYEELFYMIEINNCPFLKDKDFLLTHDLCDIPGLSEYQKDNINNERKGNKKNGQENDDEEKLRKEAEDLGLKIYKNENLNNIEDDSITDNIISTQNEQKDETLKGYSIFETPETIDKNEDDIYYENNINEKNYLTEIFTIIKNYIDGGIILFNIEKYYFAVNFKIIAKLHKVIQKEIKNFLIILNKMDKSKDPDDDKKKFNGLLNEYFPKCETFNLNKNFFIAISTLQVENELLMDKSFKHLMNYHYFNYASKVIRDKNLKSGKTFIEHLNEILTKVHGIKKEDIIKNVENLNKNANISYINEELISIVNNFENYFTFAEQIDIGISENNFKDINKNFIDFDEDFDDIDPSYIIKMMYILHKEKKNLPSYSEETNKLLDYFSRNKKKDIENKEKVEKEKDNDETNEGKINRRIINIINNFVKIIQETKLDRNQIKNVMTEIEKIKIYLEKYDNIFIPFLGPSNAGKTTIINGIIGKDILPTNLSECTKKGIIISYCESEEVTIRKVWFRENNFNGEDFRYLKLGNIIGRGLEQVKQTLHGLNYNFTDKKENFFYLVQTKIKLFDEMKLEKNFKKMIYLVDLPGYGTNNIFEKEIYNKLLSISSSFIFVVKNKLIKENYTQEIVQNIFEQAKKQKKISSSLFLKSCLFIFNIENEEKIKDEELTNAKVDIISIINELKNDDKDNINICFFKAKYYLNYCNHLDYFSNLEDSLMNDYKQFSLYKHKIFLYPENISNKIYGTFCEYLYKELIKKIKSIDFKKKFENEQKIDKNIEFQTNELKDLFADYPEFGDLDKIKNKLDKILSFACENINKTKELEESNINQLENSLSLQIKIINNNLEKDIKDKIYEITSLLDDLFLKKNILEESNDFFKIKEFKEKISEIEKNLNILKNNGKKKINLIIVKYKDKIFNSLIDNLPNFEEQLKTKYYKEILDGINNEIKSHLKSLNDEIIKFLDNDDEKPLELYNNASLSIKEFSYGTISLEKSIKFKDHFLEAFGNKEKNLDDQIFNEIIASCENLKNIYNKKGFKNWFLSIFSKTHKLTNITKMIIDTFIFKIDFIREKLFDEFDNYINRMITFINTRIDLVTLQFSKEQKDIWELIREMYGDARANLIYIKFELVNDK